MRYLEIFYSGESPKKLLTILDPQLSFKGPFFQFDTAESYVRSLVESPPSDMEIEIIDRFESRNSACVVYRFRKGSINTFMSQWFRVEDGKIKSIILIFDTARFESFKPGSDL
jgi:hypothetical protein